MFGKPLTGYYCLLYIQKVEPKVINTRVQVTFTMAGNDITGMDSTNINKVIYNALCLGLCEINQFYDNTSSTCQLCSSAMNRCLKCTASNYCT